MNKNLRLKESRIKSGLTQEQFAEKLGVKTSYVTMLENGKGFSFKKAKELAEVLGVDAEWLYFDDKESTSYPPIKTAKEKLSRNLKEDPMQSRDLIQALKDKIELMQENARLKEEIRILRGESQPENPAKGNSHAS